MSIDAKKILIFSSW